MTERYKRGDRLYQVHVHGADDYGDGMEPAEVSLSTYIVRTIRRRPRKFIFRTLPKAIPTVTAYPSEFVKETKDGLVFDECCPGWCRKQWHLDEEPGELSRTKSGAYRRALADLRRHQKGVHFRLEDAEFNMLVGRLKSAITRTTKRRDK